MDPSIRDLGIDEVKAGEKFERAFITSPNKAACIILAAVRANKRRVLVGPDARVFDWMVRLLPSRYQDITKGYTKLTTK